MLPAFRTLSLLEGISFLVILGVTLNFISRDYVYPLGMTHGVLFLLYVVFSLLLCSQQRWGLKVWLPLFLAAVVPFAFIAVDWYLRRAAVSKAGLEPG